MKKLLVLFLLLTVVAAAPMSAEMRIVGVTSGGKGVVNDLTVEIQDGKGRVLVTAEPLVGINTQQSETTAVEIAKKILGADLSDKDIIFTIHSDSYTIDGGSAGAAMTATVIAAVEGIDIPREIAITGTIEDDGSIGPVSGILAKAKAASDAGIRVFMIPGGQSRQVEYVKVREEPAPDVVVERIQAIEVNLTKEAESWGVEIVEVKDINEVVELLLKGFGGRLQEEEVIVEELPVFEFLPSEEELGKIAGRMISRARILAEEDGSSDVLSRVSEAENLFEKGYTYTGANLAFLAAIESKARIYDEERLYAEINGTLEDVNEYVGRVNSSSFYYKDDLQNIAAGEQRYVWAKIALENARFDDAVVASEWLAASRDIFSELKFSGEKVERFLIDEKAEAILEDAEDVLSKAVAVGAETRFAQRSLVFAKAARQLGFSPAVCFDSVDSIAYSAANSYSGSLSRLINTSKSFDGHSTSGWSLGYWKHSVYLRTEAAKEKDKGRAVDSIVLAIRAYGVDSVFREEERGLISLPVTRAVSDTASQGDCEREEFLAKISLVLFFSLFLATFKLARAQNKLFRLEYSKKLKRAGKRKLKLKNGRRA